MSKILTTLKRGGRAAVVALALGTVGLTAMPAMAQAPSFNFQFGIGGGGDGFSFELGRDGRHIRRECLTNNEIRRGLRRDGFDDIRFLDRRGSRVTVVAERGRRDYRISINRCTGRVLDVDRLRRNDRGRPGIGLHFNFGN